MATPISRKKQFFSFALIVIITTSYFITFSPSAGKGWEIYGYIFHRLLSADQFWVLLTFRKNISMTIRFSMDLFI